MIEQIKKYIFSKDDTKIKSSLELASTNKGEFEKYFNISYERVKNAYDVYTNISLKDDNLTIFSNVNIDVFFFLKYQKHLTIVGYKNMIDLEQLFTFVPYIESLNLDDNNVKEIPKSIQKLTNLKSLNLSNNSIKKLPIELSELKNLETLILSNNKLKSIHNDILSLKNLTKLDLFLNYLNEQTKTIIIKKWYEKIDKNNIKTHCLLY